MITIPKEEYDKMVFQLKHLEDQLDWLKRQIFGRKSEKIKTEDLSQLSLKNLAGFELEENGSESEVELEQQKIEYTRGKLKKRGNPVRTELPAHLPRKTEVIRPENLAKNAKKIGQEITEILEYNPGSLFVRQIIREKFIIPKEEDKGVFIAPMPSLPIPKGNAGASLLAYILVSKFIDHLPYYRQIQMLKRQNVTISKSTFNGWFNQSCDLLVPLYNRLVKQVKLTGYLQVDESTIKVQDQHKDSGLHLGYHWVYFAPLIKTVVFDYCPSRGQDNPESFLKDYFGTLQTDGYSAYSNLKIRGPIELLACMAHARRKFFEASNNDKKRADYALELIRQLYTVEAVLRNIQADKERINLVRDVFSKSILNELKQWLDQQKLKVLPKSKIGVAINYTLNLWDRLIRYIDDYRYLIDNNLIENQIRPLALGRKNYLFAGSHEAAQKAAMMYSLFGTCKANNVEPLEWLTDVLRRLPDHKANKLDQLLPQNWKKQ